MANILILGNGGREHTLAWKISNSASCEKLFVAPGNAGTSTIAKNVDIGVSDFKEIENFIDQNNIDFLVVGPEIPLVEGIADYFFQHPVCVLGPVKQGALLEGSKAYANDFMDKYNIPTARYKSINQQNISEGFELIHQTKGNIVLKADGLAAGKGVVILDDKIEACTILQEMLDGKFGEASSTVVIEEFLDGIEFSVFVISDGKNHITLPPAKDYKRIGEGDTGLNTGGMGSVSPPAFVSKTIMDMVERDITIPTLEGLRKENIDYRGVIFLGLILVEGKPYVIEYNCRFGDPETQSVITRINNDFVSLLDHFKDQRLNEFNLSISQEASASVVLVSGGYPEKYEKNKIIKLPENLNENEMIFHAGTMLKNNQIVTNGGRVLALNVKDKTVETALQNIYNKIDNIDFEKKYFRHDIGFDL